MSLVGIDIFSGAGGMSIGARWAGINTALAIDSDVFASQTYALNHPEAKVFNTDICSFDFLANRPKRECVVFGGPPCQGFSTSNQRTRNSDNATNWLFKEFLRAVFELEPAWVVFENVKGIAETESAWFLDRVISGLEKLGYGVKTTVLNAKDIYGREQHEKRVSKMMEHVESHLGDSVEKNMIRQIAEAHGGKVGSNKDTISHLSLTAAINGIDIRPRMLAAILKFADELADDSYRANKALQTLGAIPKESVIYHKYASCLHSVMVREDCKSIELNFSVNIDDMREKFPKFNSKTKRYKNIYILDEILERLLKMYLERLYCNRFMAPVVHIHSIVVKIKTTKAHEKIGENLPEINFRLEECGYPEANGSGIYALSDELSDWSNTGKNLTGAAFAKTLPSADVQGEV